MKFTEINTENIAHEIRKERNFNNYSFFFSSVLLLLKNVLIQYPKRAIEKNMTARVTVSRRKKNFKKYETNDATKT